MRIETGLRCTLFVGGMFLLSALCGFGREVDKHTMAIWLFDEGDGDTISDASGRGHELTVQGDYEWVDGRYGNALYFTENAFIEYPAHPDLSFADGMTIELWLNLEDITPQEVVGIPRKENEYVLAAYEQGDGMYMGPWVHNGAWVGPLNSEVVVPYGEWHHHALTYDGTDLKIYVDGQHTGTREIGGDLSQTDAPLRISNSCCGGRFFVGAIDDMRMSNVPREEAEIREAAELGLSGILEVASTGKLAVRWARLKDHR